MNIPSSDGSKLACGRPLSLTPDSPELLHKIMTRLNAYVSEKDLNRSEAREKIVTTIVREARHFRVQDLLERLKSNYPEVGKATLYRNLPVLVESGILEAGPTDSEGAIPIRTFRRRAPRSHCLPRLRQNFRISRRIH